MMSMFSTKTLTRLIRVIETVEIAASHEIIELNRYEVIDQRLSDLMRCRMFILGVAKG